MPSALALTRAEVCVSGSPSTPFAPDRASGKRDAIGARRGYVWVVAGVRALAKYMIVGSTPVTRSQADPSVDLVRPSNRPEHRITQARLVWSASRLDRVSPGNWPGGGGAADHSSRVGLPLLQALERKRRSGTDASALTDCWLRPPRGIMRVIAASARHGLQSWRFRIPADRVLPSRRFCAGLALPSARTRTT